MLKAVTTMAKSGSKMDKYTKGKRATEHQGEALRLDVVPFATRVKRGTQTTSNYHHVHVMEDNLVYGQTQDKKCLFLVDSGATINTTFFSHAEKLGLITGNEKKETQKVLLWNGYKNLDIIWLEEVVITLGGCVMRIPIKVLPKEVEEFYRNTKFIILGMQFLKPVRAFQEFSASGASTLYIRKPERLEQRPKRDRVYSSIWLKAVREGSEKSTRILVDTGAPGFFTTEALRKKQDGVVSPQRASLHLGDGSFMETSLELRPTNDKFYILGCSLLYKYDAIVDYGDGSVTFKVSDKYIRISDLRCKTSGNAAASNTRSCGVHALKSKISSFFSYCRHSSSSSIK